jgi:predicted solute-binding protein
MYARCDIIERRFDSKGGGSVVVYWHVFEASHYWDQTNHQMVYGQTAAYRFSDTKTTHYTESRQQQTRAHNEAIMQETLRTGLSQRVTQTV